MFLRNLKAIRVIFLSKSIFLKLRGDCYVININIFEFFSIAVRLGSLQSYVGMDRENPFQNSPCFILSSNPGEERITQAATFTFYCTSSPVAGQYASITAGNGPEDMRLCEVEVFAIGNSIIGTDLQHVANELI